MARKRDRVFALVIALAFLVTTVGVSVALIFQVVNEGKDTSTTEATVNTDTETETETKSQPTTLKGNNMDGFNPIVKIEKLEVKDLTPGTGAEAKAGDTVTVDYVGVTATDGKVFDSSFNHGQQVSFSLDQVIPGWSEGMVGMKEGGKRRLFIPAAKAYGQNPPQGSGIPVNADLVFDVTLHKVGQ